MFVLPVSARAADEKTIECVSQGLDPTTVEKIDAQIALFINATAGEPIAPMPASLINAIRAAAIACQARYGWSDVSTEAAIGFAFETMVRSAIERGSRTFGIDPAGIARLFYEVPQPVRQSMYGDGPPNGSPLLDLVNRGKAEHLITDANQETAVRYIETLVSIDGSRAVFIGN